MRAKKKKPSSPDSHAKKKRDTTKKDDLSKVLSPNAPTKQTPCAM
jgi:hypothetical protein